MTKPAPPSTAASGAAAKRPALRLHHILGAFSLAALVVATWATPWSGLPRQAGTAWVAVALIPVSALMLVAFASFGVPVAWALRRRRIPLFVLALIALALAWKGIEDAASRLNEAALIKLDFEELYGDFHAPLEGTFLVLGLAALCCVAPVGSAIRLGRIGIVAALACVLGTMATTASYGRIITRMPHALIDADPISSFSHAAIARAFDGDGDGSPRFAGIDCDDDDNTVNPMRPEIPGNGRDDNCLLGDRAVLSIPSYPRMPLPQPVKRVILFLWDSVRADHLWSYGYRRDTTPNLTRWADDAILFQHVSSSGGMTRQWVAGLMSGSYQKPPISEEVADVSLFEALGAAGVKRRACLLHRSASVGFERGYDEIECPGCDDLEARNTRVTGPIMWQCVQRLVDHTSADETALIVIHVFDPHFSFRLHKERPKTWKKWKRRRAEDRYDGELFFADGYFGKMMDLLESRGLTEDAAIIVTSDHGEAFGEHGPVRHGKNAYEETNRVPLMVQLPGRRGLEWVEQPVENGDLSATLLDLFGIQSELPLTGASLVPLLLDPSAKLERPQAMGYSMHEPGKTLTLAESFVLVDWPWKAIWDRQRNLWALHHLEDDPSERTNLALDRSDILAPMQRELELRVERYGL